MALYRCASCGKKKPVGSIDWTRSTFARQECVACSRLHRIRKSPDSLKIAAAKKRAREMAAGREAADREFLNTISACFTQDDDCPF